MDKLVRESQTSPQHMDKLMQESQAVSQCIVHTSKEIEKVGQHVKKLTEAMHESAPTNQEVKDIAKGAENSLLKIGSRDNSAIGAGFLVSEDGFVLTAYHICRGIMWVTNNGCFAQTYSGEIFDVMWVADFQEFDVSLLKVRTNTKCLFLRPNFASPAGTSVVISGYGLCVFCFISFSFILYSKFRKLYYYS